MRSAESLRLLLGGALVTAACFGACLAKKGTLLRPAGTRAPVLTQHNDNQRTGAYLDETSLTPASIARYGMREKAWRSLKDIVYAQPLYVPSLTVNSASRDVVFVATMANRVFALDANDGGDVWPPTTLSEAAPPRTSAQGIVSTPVISPSMDALYVVYKTAEPTNQLGNAAFWIARLNPKTGQVVQQTRVTASYKGAVLNAGYQTNRPGLLLTRNTVYLAFGAGGPAEATSVYHGWVVAYDATTLEQTRVFCTTPAVTHPGQGGGVWQSGGGLAADAAGNTYFATGNGPPDAGIEDFGDSVIKLSSPSGIQVYTPPDRKRLDETDSDLGSGGVLLIPTVNFLVAGGKTGILYTFAADTLTLMQKFHGSHSVYGSGDLYWGVTQPHLHGTPAFWQPTDSTFGYLYVWGESDVLRGLKFNTALFPGFWLDSPPCGGDTSRTTNGSDNGRYGCVREEVKSKVQAGDEYDPSECVPADPGHSPCKLMPGGILSVSANGGTPGTGIVWATLPAPQSRKNGDWLLAFDAANLHLVWTDNLKRHQASDANHRPMVGHFTPLTVADGKVFAITSRNDLEPDRSYENGLKILELNTSGTTKEGFSVAEFMSSGDVQRRLQMLRPGAPVLGERPRRAHPHDRVGSRDHRARDRVLVRRRLHASQVRRERVSRAVL